MAELSSALTVAGQGKAFEAATISGSIELIKQFVVDWLRKAEMLPSKEEVLGYVDNAFDTYIGPRIKRKLIRAALNEALLFAVGELYDQLA